MSNNSPQVCFIKRKFHVKKKISRSVALGRPRVSVFLSAKYFYIQVVDDLSSSTIASVSSASFDSSSASSVASAAASVLVNKCLALGVREVVFDRGGYVYSGLISKIADALRSSGFIF